MTTTNNREKPHKLRDLASPRWVRGRGLSSCGGVCRQKPPCAPPSELPREASQLYLSTLFILFLSPPDLRGHRSPYRKGSKANGSRRSFWGLPGASETLHKPEQQTQKPQRIDKRSRTWGGGSQRSPKTLTFKKSAPDIVDLKDGRRKILVAVFLSTETSL